MKKITYRIADAQSADLVAKKIASIYWAEITKPLIVTIEPEVKKRSTSQNAMQWAGMIGDFVEQGEVDGRKFDADTWHYFLKERFLPPVPEEGITMEGYSKWTESPGGTLILTGSTTKLTTLGMSNYMEQCYAFGAQELGIKFSANPNDF